jgi:catechol 2,3-dioxygenase-like lactoylglutathione lyase family enzyme
MDGRLIAAERRGRDSLRRYRDVLGFAVMAQLGSHAVFLSAGGYHHHLGANTWERAEVRVPPPGAAALRHATIVLPDDAERDRVLERVERSGQSPQESSNGPVIRDPDKAGRVSWYGSWWSGGARVKRKLGLKRTQGTADGLTRAQAERSCASGSSAT